MMMYMMYVVLFAMGITSSHASFWEGGSGRETNPPLPSITDHHSAPSAPRQHFDKVRARRVRNRNRSESAVDYGHLRRLKEHTDRRKSLEILERLSHEPMKCGIRFQRLAVLKTNELKLLVDLVNRKRNIPSKTDFINELEKLVGMNTYQESSFNDVRSLMSKPQWLGYKIKPYGDTSTVTFETFIEKPRKLPDNMLFKDEIVMRFKDSTKLGNIEALSEKEANKLLEYMNILPYRVDKENLGEEDILDEIEQLVALWNAEEDRVSGVFLLVCERERNPDGSIKLVFRNQDAMNTNPLSPTNVEVVRKRFRNSRPYEKPLWRQPSEGPVWDRESRKKRGKRGDPKISIFTMDPETCQAWSGMTAMDREKEAAKKKQTIKKHA